MASIPPRMHPHSLTMDDRFHVWQAEMEKKQEDHKQCMQSLLQHAKQLRWENEELRAQMAVGHHASWRSHQTTN